jgi:hypothetical protein
VELTVGAINRLVVDPGAVFIGAVYGGNPIGNGTVSTLEFASGSSAGTFAGLGSHYAEFVQVSIDADAAWTASGSNIVAAGQTLSDDGTLRSIGSFTNAGMITLGTTQGIKQTGGTFVNDGHIFGGATASAGVYAYGGAYVSNAMGATITGGTLNAAVAFTYATVVNAGVMNGGRLGGAYVLPGGVVINLATGTLVGSTIGFGGYGGTLVNAGTVMADNPGGAAVHLQSYHSPSYNPDYRPRLVVQPGAVFIGTVDGGVSAGPGYISTLEFASGSSAGTFAAVGSQYVDFSQVSFDAGATWVASGYNHLYGGQSLTNDGSISAYPTLAVILYAANGAFVSNAAGATISGGTYEVVGERAGATLINEGVISGGKYGGVYVFPGAVATNAASGTIAGSRWGFAGEAGTLVNAGTILAGYTGDAVYFNTRYGSGEVRVVADPGAVFGGTVNGGNAIGSSYTSTLEFASGSSAGTFAGLGSLYVNFAQISIDAGAKWTASGINTLASGYTLTDSGSLTVASNLYGSGMIDLAGGATLALGDGVAVVPTISGITGNTLLLEGVDATVQAYGGGQLTLSDGLTLSVTHEGAGSYTAESFTATYSSGNTVITACFASGTRIEGAFGPVPVEALRVGDTVRTARGRLAPVKWIGFRRTALAKHPHPLDVMPVRVRAGAFGDNRPVRDLVLSPDHAVFLDGHLVPVRYLVNGVSIVQERREAVTYWHVELDRHDLILAEGLACESYLDTGNRHAFEGEMAVQMHPEFARDHALAVWQAAGCAPILVDPTDARLRRLHRRLLARAAAKERRTPQRRRMA